MSVLKRIAAWLDPEPQAARDESKSVILNQQDAINEMSAKIEELSRANDNLIRAASGAGLRANARGDIVKQLVTELVTARAYVVDAIDQIDEELSKMSTKSKKRTTSEAVRAAVAADIVRINTTLDAARGIIS